MLLSRLTRRTPWKASFPHRTKAFSAMLRSNASNACSASSFQSLFPWTKADALTGLSRWTKAPHSEYRLRLQSILGAISRKWTHIEGHTQRERERGSGYPESSLSHQARPSHPTRREYRAIGFFERTTKAGLTGRGASLRWPGRPPADRPLSSAPVLPRAPAFQRPPPRTWGQQR